MDTNVMRWRKLRVRLRPPWERTYRDIFVAITDGHNRKAAQLLRGLNADHLDELAVICGDVRQMTEAAQRLRREPPNTRTEETSNE